MALRGGSKLLPALRRAPNSLFHNEPLQPSTKCLLNSRHMQLARGELAETAEREERVVEKNLYKLGQAPRH